MNRHVFPLVLVVLLCLLMIWGGAALAQPAGPAGAVVGAAPQSGAPVGGYHLSALTWRVSGGVRGGGYVLRGPAPVQGAGCCCTYLPCVPRDLP